MGQKHGKPVLPTYDFTSLFLPDFKWSRLVPLITVETPLSSRKKKQHISLFVYGLHPFA